MKQGFGALDFCSGWPGSHLLRWGTNYNRRRSGEAFNVHFQRTLQEWLGSLLLHRHRLVQSRVWRYGLGKYPDNQ